MDKSVIDPLISSHHRRETVWIPINPTHPVTSEVPNPVLYSTTTPQTIERSVPKQIKLPTQLLPTLESPPDKSLTPIPVLLARQVSMAALLDPS